MTTIETSAVTHEMTRLNIHTGIPFDQFCAELESAAPAFEPARFEHCQTWDDVLETMSDFAPHGLTTYARMDTRAHLDLSGTRTPAVEYLIGNHTIAETMFRHDPNALLYAPLRVLVFSDDSGAAVFAIDRPSTVFAGLRRDDIAATGRLLDDKVAGLLAAIGVDARAVLAAS